MRGIIPACAGNTLRTVEPIALAGDHPRMRGEHTVRVQNAVRVLGSSPHARGTQSDYHVL